MTDFSYETTVAVRFQDYDMLGHVNNAVYATYLEEARARYLTDVLDITPEEIQSVLAHLELDFDAPLQDVASITVGVRVTDIGTKSITMACQVRDDETTYATAETVLVTVDPDTGTPAAVPDAWIDVIAEYEGGLPGRD